jgi:hypothetical protein
VGVISIGEILVSGVVISEVETISAVLDRYTTIISTIIAPAIGATNFKFKCAQNSLENY